MKATEEDTDHFDGSASGATAEKDHSSDGQDGPLDVLSKFQADVSAAGGRLLEVFKDRARLSTRRALIALSGAVGVAVFAAMALGSAASAVTSGACAAFTELFGGREWLGNLAGGLAVLALFGLALVLVKHASERKALRSLRAKYGDSPHEHTHATDSDVAEENAARDIRG